MSGLEAWPLLPVAVAVLLLGVGMLGGVLKPSAKRSFELGFALLTVLALGAFAVAEAIEAMQSGRWLRAALTLALFLVVALVLRHRAMQTPTTRETGS